MKELKSTFFGPRAMHFPSLQAEAQNGDGINDDGDGDHFGGALGLLSELVDSQV